jgi:uncharacterized membrane protein YGL010W
MLDWNNLFEQYEASHTHPMNRLCHQIGIPLIIITTVVMIFDHNQLSNFSGAMAIWYIGWGFQFIGHAFERTLPEFLRNPIFLIVGPIYFVKKIIRKFR